MYKVLPLIIASLLFFASCGDKEKDAKLAKVDILKAEIKSIDSTFNSYSIDSIDFINTDIKKDLDLIAEDIMKSDNDSMRLIINRYSVILKTIKTFGKKKKELAGRIETSAMMIDSLYYDVNNNLETSGQFESYYQDELNEINSIKEGLVIFKRIKSEKDIYYEYKEILSVYLKEAKYKKQV